MNKKRALISVWDKKNIIEFAKELIKAGYEIISTGGTYQVLHNNNINAIEIEDITNFPEILSGRVKTLNPKIHGALLSLRDNEEHLKELKEHDINFIDIVVVNLYPFINVINKEDTTLEIALQNIDIGGPSMLRSAAKNYKWVSAISDIADYDLIIKEIKEFGNTVLKTREYLAAKVFRTTSFYDAHIANYMNKITNNNMPNKLIIPFEKVQDLRYGENPHQSAGFYTNNEKCPSISNAKQIQGKKLSYNNIRDADSAIKIILEFEELTMVSLKHMNPCGLASGDSIDDVWTRCYEGDTVSIFGGIIATNGIINENVAKQMSNIFLEIIIANDFTEDALNIFKSKKNLRILRLNFDNKVSPVWEYTSVNGGILRQEMDLKNIDDCKITYATKRKPNERELSDIIFAQKIVKHVKSNAIIIVKDKQLIGVGAGQMNRLSSTKIALEWSKDKSNGATLASDAFLPFNDVVALSNEYKITSIVQPGGSIRDQESIDLANKHNMSMVFTKMRHFKH